MMWCGVMCCDWHLGCESVVDLGSLSNRCGLRLVLEEVESQENKWRHATKRRNSGLGQRHCKNCYRIRANVERTSTDAQLKHVLSADKLHFRLAIVCSRCNVWMVDG